MNTKNEKIFDQKSPSVKSFLEKTFAKRKHLILQIFKVEAFDVKMPILINNRFKDGVVLQSEIQLLSNAIIRFMTTFIKGRDFCERIDISFFVEKVGIESPYCFFRINDNEYVLKYDIALGGEDESPQSIEQIYHDFINFGVTLRDTLMEVSDSMGTSVSLFRFKADKVIH